VVVVVAVVAGQMEVVALVLPLVVEETAFLLVQDLLEQQTLVVVAVVQVEILLHASAVLVVRELSLSATQSHSQQQQQQQVHQP
jgi:hypothetical protein